MISFLTSVLLSNVLCICYFLNYIKLPIIEVKDFVVLWNLLQYLVLMLMTLEFVVFPLKNGSWPLYNCLWLKLVWSTNFQRIIKPKFYSSYLFQHFFVPFFFFFLHWIALLALPFFNRAGPKSHLLAHNCTPETSSWVFEGYRSIYCYVVTRRH